MSYYKDLQLHFIGNGSAFNTGRWSNSAFIKYGNSLLLFDCGSTTFHRLLQQGVLDNVNDITVLVTHLHDDHIGSLGCLIAYAHWVLNAEIDIVFPTEEIVQLLDLMGVPRDQYGYYPIEPVTFETADDEHENESLDIEAEYGTISVQAVETEHVEGMNCYGYTVLVHATESIFYYSGDANIIPEPVLESFLDEEIDILYQDTCIADYKGNVHLSLRKLCELIPESHRNAVYCMHLDSHFDIDGARELGFNVVEIVC